MRTPMPTGSWQRRSGQRSRRRSISKAGGATSAKRSQSSSRPEAEAPQEVQAEHREQEREPDRIGAIEKEAFQRGQIDSEQPDPQQRHGQRPAIATCVGALKV